MPISIKSIVTMEPVPVRSSLSRSVQDTDFTFETNDDGVICTAKDDSYATIYIPYANMPYAILNKPTPKASKKVTDEK